MKESSFTLSDIQVTDKLSDIRINSFSYIKIIVLVENEFAIEINDDSLEVLTFETVEDLCNYVTNLINVGRISR
ncbi:acyl carrier protein [compost metagenome]